MPAAVGDVAELGDVDVDQRAGVRVLVTPDRFTRHTIDVAEPVQSTPHQHRVHGRGWHASRPPIWTGLSRWRQRSRMIRRLRSSGVRRGLECGRLDRSAIPAAPSSRNRATHFRAVGGETMNIVAASDGVQPSSTINLTRRKRAFGVRAALAWDTKASWLMKRLLDISTSQPEAFTIQQLRTVSRRTVPGHHMWVRRHTGLSGGPNLAT
jgi:hypothetical protein